MEEDKVKSTEKPKEKKPAGKPCGCKKDQVCVKCTPFTTVDSHNAARRKWWELMNSGEGLDEKGGSGLSCPKCGKQVTIKKGSMLAGFPPKVTVDCPSEDYHGDMIY